MVKILRDLGTRRRILQGFSTVFDKIEFYLYPSVSCGMLLLWQEVGRRCADKLLTDTRELGGSF